MEKKLEIRGIECFTRRKVPVSKRALIQRINRALLKRGEKLRTARLRGGYECSDLGRYYILDIERNVLVSTHVDLEKTARQLKVLEEYESIL